MFDLKVKDDMLPQRREIRYGCFRITGLVTAGLHQVVIRIVQTIQDRHGDEGQGHMHETWPIC